MTMQASSSNGSNHHACAWSATFSFIGETAVMGDDVSILQACPF
jgi:hypothetical protein